MALHLYPESTKLFAEKEHSDVKLSAEKEHSDVNMFAEKERSDVQETKNQFGEQMREMMMSAAYPPVPGSSPQHLYDPGA